jgi:uncharacterized membrane protein YccC
MLRAIGPILAAMLEQIRLAGVAQGRAEALAEHGKASAIAEHLQQCHDTIVRRETEAAYQRGRADAEVVTQNIVREMTSPELDRLTLCTRLVDRLRALEILGSGQHDLSEWDSIATYELRTALQWAVLQLASPFPLPVPVSLRSCGLVPLDWRFRKPADQEPDNPPQTSD